MKFLDHFISNIISPPAFGLDISDFTAKFVKLTKKGSAGLTIAAFGEEKLSEGVMVQGEIKKEDELIALLKNNLVGADGRHFSDRFVVATLPEEKSFVHLIQLPKMKPEDAGKAARWELEGIVPLPIEELYFDYAILPTTVEAIDHLDLLVTAFPKALVQSYVRILEGAGFIPVALELESQAISRALWNGEQGVFLFVDLGATRTSSIIVSDGSLIFTLSIPIGGHDFERVIAERTAVSMDEARKVKIKYGLNNGENDTSREALIPLVSALADELKKQMMFYRERYGHRHDLPDDISAIVLSGGDANLIGLTDYLSITLEKEVKLGNPLSRLLRQESFMPPFSRSESLKYTTAIGSALRGVGL